MGLAELDHPKKYLAGKTFDHWVPLGRTIQRCLGSIPEDEYKKNFLSVGRAVKIITRKVTLNIL